MYIKNEELKLNEGFYVQRKYLPYESKVKLAVCHIREWVEEGGLGMKEVLRYMDVLYETWEFVGQMRFDIHGENHEYVT